MPWLWILWVKQWEKLFHLHHYPASLPASPVLLRIIRAMAAALVLKVIRLARAVPVAATKVLQPQLHPHPRPTPSSTWTLWQQAAHFHECLLSAK